MQAAHLGKGDITRTLIRQQSRFPRTAQNLVALEQHKEHLIQCGAMRGARLAGRPFFDNAV